MTLEVYIRKYRPISCKNRVRIQIHTYTPKQIHMDSISIAISLAETLTSF